MGRYTIYDNEIVDREIDNKLKIVVECIAKHLKDNLQSILLAGGYGRGEGGVTFEDGNVKLLKDFDMAIVVNAMPDKATTSLILEDIYKSLKISNPERSLFKYNDFALDLRYLEINNINFPDIWFYDLKNSMHLYGKDVRGYITYSSDEIPLSSAARLLFEKITGLLGHFEYEMLNGNIKPDAKMRLVYECMKTYVEIATVLCILYKSYVSSYVKRVEIIKKLYEENKLREIVKEIPDLLDMIEIATKFKVSPNDVMVKDPIDLLFKTREDLSRVIRFFMRHYINFDIKDWLDVEVLSKRLSKVYYKPMLEAWFKNKFGNKYKMSSSIMNTLYQIYTNAVYVRIIKDNCSKIYLKPLLHGCTVSPSLKFFPAGLLILLALNRDGSSDARLLSKSVMLLRRLIPIDEISNWSDARKAYLLAYKYYLYPTLLK